MKKRIHVNQHNIRANGKDGGDRPVITAKTYKSNSYGHELVIYDDSGKEVARLIYSPEDPLSCGAKVWLESTNKVVVVNNVTGEQQVLV